MVQTYLSSEQISLTSTTMTELITQFDAISSEYDELIDECFHEWAYNNNVPYWPDGESDYPNEFKEYFMQNGGTEQ